MQPRKRNCCIWSDRVFDFRGWGWDAVLCYQRQPYRFIRCTSITFPALFHQSFTVYRNASVGLTLCCFVVYSTRRFVLCLTLCHFVLVFFSPFSIAITSLGEERANLSGFRAFVRFVYVWICRFPLPLGVWEGLRFVIVAHPGPLTIF